MNPSLKNFKTKSISVFNFLDSCGFKVSQKKTQITQQKLLFHMSFLFCSTVARLESPLDQLYLR